MVLLQYFIFENRNSFHSSAKINLANGKLVRVDELKAGVQVLAYGSKIATVKQIIEGPEQYPFIKLKTAKSEIKLTRYHLVPTDSGLKQARYVSTSNKLTDSNGKALELR
jgi:hypothetical protein